MINYDVVGGTTDYSVVIRIIDSTDGTPETGVVYNTSGIDLEYRREGATSTDITEATLAGLDSAHADGGFLHIGNGYYRLDLPDAAVAAGVKGCLVHGVVTGMVVIGCYIHIHDVATARYGVNVVQISADATAADNAELFFDGTGYAGGTTKLKVDVETIKTQAVTCGAGVTVLASVGTAATSTAQTGDTYALANGANGFVNIKTDTAAILLDTGTDGVVLGADSITAAKIADNAFSNEHFAAGALTSAEITSAAGCAVTSLGAGVITAAAIATDAIDADAIADGAITSGVFASGAITAAAIAADAIGASELAADAVTEIQSGLATAAELAKVPKSDSTVSWNATALAAINAEVVDAINVDTYAEPAQGAPAATASLVTKIGYLYKSWRNKKTQTSSQWSLFNDDAATIDHKAAVTDDGSTTTKGEIATGP